ncbi:MAG: phenylalanine--tRNA ligase subunit beta [Acidobacteria bacterium]|nr:phenylalanine--tRNA ligase subunit beta [Acidobacteriota bacterium]
MKLPISWMREFVELPDDPASVAGRLAACGFAVDGIEDGVVDFDVTANRPDALSVYGLAREASAAFDAPLRPLQLATAAPGPAPLRVSIADTGCGRYALAVADVRVGPSPVWLADRLTAAGVRPINNIVDITNYVMIEMGQPMHAFDVARLAGPELRVRRARAGEPLTTLDGVGRTLDETMLVIADRDRAVAVAGVMGGSSSDVSASTTRVAFESAWFQPATVRATGRRLGLKTEASARFERGADINAPVNALRRALALLTDLGAGTLVGGVSDVYPRSAEPRAITLRRTRLASVLGSTVPDADVQRLLTRLGFTAAAADAGWKVTVPSFRVDVSREIDLIEEVGRHWGLDRIPAHFPALASVPRAAAPGVARGRLVRRTLCGAGLQEAVTFTFMDAAAAAPYQADDAVTITNPLSEKFAVLRPSIVASVYESLVYNRNRQAADVRLFEVGSVFSSGRGERAAVGWVLTGSRGAHWSGDAGPIDFTDTKGIAELVAEAFGTPVTVAQADDLSWLVRGERAEVLVGARRAGWIGRLTHASGVEPPVYAGELELDALSRASAGSVREIRPLPRFPSAVRDLSILVDERLPAADVRGTIRTSAPSTLVAVREFDRYQGKGVPAGQVSLSIRLTFRHADRTLTDAEVQQAVESIVEALARAHHATLRGR